MSVKKNLEHIKDSISKDVVLVAVSKTKPYSAIEEVYAAGHHIFGENKVQELTEKYQALPKDIKWHFIGHLQTNKVKYIAPFVELIHAVDSLKLATEIQKRAAQNNRTIDILIQVRIAKEETKFGLVFSEAAKLIEELKEGKFPNVNAVGLMGMATNTKNQEQIRAEFISLKNFFEKQKELTPLLHILSMGMSSDYPLAIACGSNMVRIGSSIFGARN